MRLFFYLIALLTLADFLRHRDRTRLEIALMFTSIALVIVVVTSQAAPARWLRVLGSIAVAAQPYLLLRLVEHIRPIPAAVRAAALGSMLAAWLILLATPTPRPPALTLAAAAYFLLVEGYATLACIRGALFTRGVTRSRLLLAAAGSGLFAGVILLVTLVVAAPALVSRPPAVAEAITLLGLPLLILAPVAYLLGFAPPRWVRRVWQLAELHHFLAEAAGRPPAGDPLKRAFGPAALLDHLGRAAADATGAAATAVALWDEADERLRLHVTGDDAAPPDVAISAQANVIGQAWRERRPRLARRPDDLDAGPAIPAGADVMMVAPISTPARAWGLLLVFLRRRPLFPDDDLELLTLLAEQCAILLDNAALLAERTRAVEEIRRLNEGLERRVAERTAQLEAALRELEVRNAEVDLCPHGGA